MGQECFYRENRADRAERELLLTERLKGEDGALLWRIRPMTQRENEELWKRSGEDEGRYQEMILAESVVFPDLKEAALQNRYGALGAERLLAKMLLAGEYDCLRRAVDAINGGEDDGCIGFI